MKEQLKAWLDSQTPEQLRAEIDKRKHLQSVDVDGILVPMNDNFVYIEAPNYVKLPWDQPSIFLAGGITGCENWQAKATEALKEIGDVTVVNPRRQNYDVNGGFDLVKEQIKWEHHYLDRVHQVIFWFSSETIQPITLFELGCRLRDYRIVSRQPLFIGCHPDYARKWDVFIQSSLEGYDMQIKDNLDDLLNNVIEFNRLCKALRTNSQ